MHGSSAVVARRSVVRLARLISIIVVTLIGFAQLTFSGSAAGAPLYPDLIPFPASRLSIEHTSDGRYRIRFDSTTGNYGGRLEVAVAAGSRDLYQNIYDGNVSGARVLQIKVGVDLIFHPTHNHFHFVGFSEYELLRRDSAGAYRETSREGSKTSFCLLDLVRVNSSGPISRHFAGCGATVQGISAGWADSYIASIPGQWIDVGTAMLADGAYAIRTTADPLNKLHETRDYNNVSVTYFTVANGRITVSSTPPPLCGINVAYTVDDVGSVAVGTPVEMNCAGFGSNEDVDIYWGSINTTPRATVDSTSSGAVSAILPIPNDDQGVHYLIAKGRTSGLQAAAVVNLVPSVVPTPPRGIVDSKVTVTVRGFSASESVTVRYFKTVSQSVVLGTIATTGRGSGSISVPIPPSVHGVHKIEATGQASGTSASATYSVKASMAFKPESVAAGDDVGVALRGFEAGESVRITIAGTGKYLNRVTASHSGSTTPSSASFVVPASLNPGDYEILATGTSSLATAREILNVTEAEGSEEPSPTPAIQPTSTDTPTEAPVITNTPTPTEMVESTATPEPTSTEGATQTPTETVTPDPTATDSQTATPEPIQTETPTATATAPPEPTSTATSTTPP